MLHLPSLQTEQPTDQRDLHEPQNIDEIAIADKRAHRFAHLL